MSLAKVKPKQRYSDDEAKARAQEIYINQKIIRLNDIGDRVGRDVATIKAWKEKYGWLDLRSNHYKEQKEKLEAETGHPKVPLIKIWLTVKEATQQLHEISKTKLSYEAIGSLSTSATKLNDLQKDLRNQLGLD